MAEQHKPEHKPGKQPWRKAEEDEADPFPAPTPHPAAPLAPSEHKRADAADDGPPKAPVADAGGPVPRKINQMYRAPRGLKRFVIRCDNVHAAPTEYILARTREEAELHYEDIAGLKVVRENAIRNLQRTRGVSVPLTEAEKELVAPPFILATTELPD